MKLEFITNIAVFFFISLIKGNQGSVITFKQDPDVALISLTSTLTLTCELNDTAPSGSLVGRDLGQSVDNVQHVTSIVVTNDAGHVASVTQFDAAHALTPDTALSVEGSVSGVAGLRGYLRLTWSPPTFNQSGPYSCEVNALSALGHNVKFRQDLGLEVSTPSLLDLANYVHNIGKENTALKSQVSTLVNDNHNLKSQVSTLVTDNQNLKTQVSSLSADNHDLHTQIGTMQLTIDNQKHIEHGRISCGGSDTWPQEDNFLIKHNTVQFLKAYTKPPIVHMSIVYWSKPTDADINYLYIPLEHTDVNSFKMRCEVPLSHTVVGGAYVDWISFPA